MHPLMLIILFTNTWAIDQHDILLPISVLSMHYQFVKISQNIVQVKEYVPPSDTGFAFFH